ncbi:alpha/beta fold hydrolase, partial [Candidatus Woesearchaeota archaeon]|nr:alpha/beta fold hydrolase [Candidatus Woesearchaeota archaeon]
TASVDIAGNFGAYNTRPEAVGIAVILVSAGMPPEVCDQQELCKIQEIPEKPAKFPENFYEKPFAMYGNKNVFDEAINVYLSASTDYVFNQLPKQAEIEFCDGVEITKATAEIEWALADGWKAGALTTKGACGYCSAVYAGAMQGDAEDGEISVGGTPHPSTMGIFPKTTLGPDYISEEEPGYPEGDSQADEPTTLAVAGITGSAAAQITGSAVSGSPAGAEDDFPSIGIMPQVLGGGTGTWLGRAEFEESIEGHTTLSVDRPKPASGSDNGNGITSAAFADITGMAVDTADDTGDGTDTADEGTATNGRETQEDPNGETDSSDPDKPHPQCVPENEQEEPVPERKETPVVDYSSEDWKDVLEFMQGYSESGEKPAGDPIEQFFTGIYPEWNWARGEGLVDYCLRPAVIDACINDVYQNPAYDYTTPFGLLAMQGEQSTTPAGMVVNEITGSASAGSPASGCAAAEGQVHNCGLGVNSPGMQGTGAPGSETQNHHSAMNNALGAQEHCDQGLIICQPCPASVDARKTPEFEQPEGVSGGRDKPGKGWVHYCGVDGDLHTLFFGPNGVTSPTGNIVPPMEEFEPGLLSYMKSMITGSVVAGTELPQGNLMGTVEAQALKIYEKRGKASEFCLEKETVCSSDGRCLPYCTEKPGPPLPPPIPAPPSPPPPSPPVPPGPEPTPPPVPGPDDVADTTPVREMPNYCTSITNRKTVGPITGTPVSGEFEVPAGYELIAGPVSFDCLYDDMDLKFNVPDNFKDIRAFRCAAGSCTAVADTHAFSGELVCDGLPVSEYRRRELLAGKVYLDPEEVEVIERYEALVSSNKKSVVTQGYEFEFTGEAPSGTMVGLFSPDFTVPLAANPSIAIISTPLVVEFDKEVPSGIDARITMPFEYTENFEKDSIAIYLLQDGMWIRLDSTLEDSTVSAYLYDIANYIEDDKLVFAVMAVRCEACIVSDFKQVYDPGSRDAIILVHGLTSSSKTWQFLIDDYVFNRQPWQIWTFDYPSYMTVDEMAKDLADAIQVHNAKFDNIYIVGHSLGGFIGQRALEIADENPSVYSFIGKARKLILAGNPGQGSPAAKVYDNLFDELLNLRSVAKVFNLNSEVVDDLVEGRQFSRVDGVKYYVIAGTESYEFNLGLFSITAGDVFELLGINDGIVTTDSASFVGGEHINEICRDYFEIKLTHTELIDDSMPRRIIARIIASEKALENPDVAYLGYNKYVNLLVDRCNPEEYFVIVGKRMTELETPAPLNCNCGNGVCGEGENADNCPQDCKGISLALCMWLPLLLLLLLLLLVLMTFIYLIRKRVQKKEVGAVWKTILWFLILLILLILILLWFICAYWHWLNWVVVILAALVIGLDSLIPFEPRKKKELEVAKKGKKISKKKK